MTVAATSREAYQSIKTKLGRNQGVVYSTLKARGRASREELADMLGWSINELTPRVCELINFGMVKKDGRTVSKAGKSVEALVVTDLNDKKLLEMDCE